MTRRSLAQMQLSLLTAIHFTVDMISGLLPGILPVLLVRFDLSIGAGVWLVALCSFSSNGLQIVAGRLRANSARPLLIPLGIALSCAICLVGLVPPTWPWVLSGLILILGAGVALVHPEGLRGVCAIDPRSVLPTMATPVFMLAGFLGYACGPLIGGVLVEYAGLMGLFWLILPAALLIWALRPARIRLAVEKPGRGNSGRATLPESPFTFWQIFFLASLLNTGCAIMQGLLPSFLNTLGYSLVVGGFGAMLFGLGAGIGALYTGKLIRKYPVVGCIQAEMAVGLPLLILFLMLAEAGWSLLLVPLTGALVGAGFPQLVVLARTAPGGPSLGARMGLIVGGSWGVAGVLLLAVGRAADLWGLDKAMFLAPLAFGGMLLACRLLQPAAKKEKLK